MSEGDFQIEIDGRSVPARRGEMIIHVADREGIFIPRFCYHEKLSIAANCRMCLVQVERAPKPLPACATPVMDGMKVSTRSDYARDAQQSVMEFLLINHPLDCPICDQGGECELQDLAMGYGTGVSRFSERKRVVEDQDLGPLIATDMTRCIHCTRCVRFGTEIAGMTELGATGRGEDMRIGTYIAHAMVSELSGNVIDVCPVGALTSKPFRYRARTWEMQVREAVAPHDAVGSNLFVHVAQRRIMRVVPRRNDAVNETWISDRDRFSYEGLYSADRLQAPALRVDGEWRNADWDEALDRASERLRAVIDAHGPEAVGVLAAPGATAEEHFLLQKLARGLGIDNLDHRVHEADFRDQAEAPACWTLGRPLATLETVGAALIIGSNSRQEFPLLNHRLRKAALAGAALRHLNAVDYPGNFDAHAPRLVSPARWVEELTALATALVEHTGKSLGGLPAAEVLDWHREVAAELAGAEQAAVLLGAAAAAHPRAAELRALAASIAHLTGASAGMLPPGANHAGAALAGMLPHRGPGGVARKRAGLDARAMLASPRRAYILLGLEPELDCLDSAAALSAMRQADCVISLCGYDTVAAREYADVLLPIGLFAETDGSCVNVEGRWQWSNAAVAAPGAARPAWKVLRVLANKLGIDGFDYMRSDTVRGELRAACAKVTLQGLPRSAMRIEAKPPGGGLWRCADTPMYAVDALVRRAGALQHTPDAGQVVAARLHPDEMRQLGLTGVTRVCVEQGGHRLELPLLEDWRVVPGCVHIASGVAESAALGGVLAPATLARIVAEERA